MYIMTFHVVQTTKGRDPKYIFFFFKDSSFSQTSSKTVCHRELWKKKTGAVHECNFLVITSVLPIAEHDYTYFLVEIDMIFEFFFKLSCPLPSLRGHTVRTYTYDNV